MLSCRMEAKSMRLGLKGNPPFLDEAFEGGINSDESLWTMEDGEIHLTITKGSKGQTWPCVFKGHTKVRRITRRTRRTWVCPSICEH